MTKYFIVILQLVSCSSFSQSIIRGRVLDKDTKAPVSYANISVTNSSAGTATDEGGNFFIRIDAAYAKENLRISSIGFGSGLISIDSLSSKSVEDVTVFLKPQQFILEDVIVSAKKLSAEQMLQDAVAAIPKNYSQEPFNLEFYSKIDVNDSTKTHYTSENILLTYRKGYVGGASNWSKILQQRSRGTSPLAPFKDKKTKKEYFPYGHAFDLSLSDQLGMGSNGYTVFNPKKAKGMKFTFAESTIFDQDTVVAINYSEGHRDYNGVIYISVNNLAIIKHSVNIGSTTREIVYKKYNNLYYPYSIRSEYPSVYSEYPSVRGEQPVVRSKHYSIHQAVSLQRIISKDVQTVESNQMWSEEVPYDKTYWDKHFPIK